MHGDGRRRGIVEIDGGAPLHARRAIRVHPGKQGRVRPHRGSGVLGSAVAPLLGGYAAHAPVHHRQLLHLLRLRMRVVLAPVQDAARDAPRDRRAHQNDDDDEGDGDDDVRAGRDWDEALTVVGGSDGGRRCRRRTYACKHVVCNRVAKNKIK